MTDFGRDISCATELRTGRFSTGVRLVAEALYRRLTTPRGMLRGGEDEANYGIDLADLIGTSASKASAATLEGRIRAEALKDERIETCGVVVTRSISGPRVEFSIVIECTTAAGPFSLKLSVNDVSVELLGIGG